MSGVVPNGAAAERFAPQLESLHDWIADLAGLELDALAPAPAAAVPRSRLGALGAELRGGASAVGLAEQALRRLAKTEPQLNAFITVDERGALARAREIDDELGRGIDRGPLAGIPIAIKDCLTVPGMPTSGGCSVLRDHRPATASPLVDELVQAGVVIVGTTNLNEFCWGLDAAIGAATNPIDPTRSAGGSSSGSAVAVAAGVVPLAIGTDSGGSVRLPAAFCGVVGFTPTRGVLDGSGPFGASSLGSAGLLAPAVEDVALALRALGRGGALAPRSGPLRVGVLAGALETRDAEVGEALGRLLAELGRRDVVIGDACVPALGQWTAPWMATFMAEMREAADRWFPDGVEPAVSDDVAAALAIGDRVPAWAYVRAQRFRRSLTAEVDEALAHFDVLLSPTVDHLAPAGEPDWGDPGYFGGMRWTAPFNLTGHPTLAVPVRTTAPLPASVQVIGRHGADLAVLAVGAEIERASVAVEAEAADARRWPESDGAEMRA